MQPEPVSGESLGTAQACAERIAPNHGRRSFLGVLLAVGGAGVGAVLAVPLVRFALHPLLQMTTPTAWSEIGSADEFASATQPVKKLIEVEQRDGWRKTISERAVYITKDSTGQLAVLSAVCPHLGCSVTWRTENQEFVCPCHNGHFAGDGKLLSGPPPRGLDLLESRVEDGKLKVHYQYFRQLVPHKEVIA